MAKTLQFTIGGSIFDSLPVKLERKKLYEWVDVVAADEKGGICISAQLAPGGTLIVPPGGVKPAALDSAGRWLEKSELTPPVDAEGKPLVDAEGKPLATVPSSFDAPIVLETKVTEEKFLDHVWKAVYQLNNAELAAAVGDDICAFPFSYRGGLSHDDGFLLKSGSTLFLFTGERTEFEMVVVAEEGVLDDNEEENASDEEEELDFSMM